MRDEVVPQLLDLAWNRPALRVSIVDSLTTASRMCEAEVLLDTTKLLRGTSTDAIRRRLVTRQFRSVRTVPAAGVPWVSIGRLAHCKPVKTIPSYPPALCHLQSHLFRSILNLRLTPLRHHSESLSAPRGHVSRVPKLVESHILHHLHGDPITILVLIPSNVSTLIPETTTFTSPAAFSHESIVGFHSTETPTIIRLSGAENALDFWRRAAVIGELESQLRVRLSDVGYTVIHGSPKAKALGSSRIAGSQNVDWKGVERKTLTEGEARVTAEIKEVCLRIENEMGLYETRNGRAVIVRVELAVAFTTNLIHILSIYRVVEFAGDFFGRVANTQASFMVFERPVFVFAAPTLTIVHLERVFVRLRKASGKGAMSNIGHAKNGTLDDGHEELTAQEGAKTCFGSGALRDLG